MNSVLKKVSVALFAGTILAGAFFAAAPTKAQVPALPGPPYNVDLGALVSGTRAANASASNTATQTNLAYNGVLCTFNMSAASGSPSTTFGIQFLDSASNTWQTLVTSGAITSTATPTSIVVAPGIQTSSLPSAMVAIQLKLPRFWRITEANTVSTTTATRTIGCNVFR
jgi:hypothetical protein